jgi:hypothetical protein
MLIQRNNERHISCTSIGRPELLLLLLPVCCRRVCQRSLQLLLRVGDELLHLLHEAAATRSPLLQAHTAAQQYNHA